MQLSDIRTELRAAVGGVTVADVPDSALTSLINRAYRYIATVYPNLTSRAVVTTPTIANQQDYVLPVDCFALRGAWDTTNNVKLIRKGERWAGENRWVASTPAKPLYYVRFTNLIQLWPIPDGVYNIDIYYQQNISDLVADTDIPVLSVPWHDGLVLKARWYYYDRLRTDIPKAAASDTSWRMWLQEMPTALDQETVDIDSGVEIPTLRTGMHRRLDFDFAP